jgi:LysM repeat protein
MNTKPHYFFIILFTLFCTSLAFANNVTLAVTPGTTTVDPNQTFTVNVEVQAGSGQVDGVETYLNFDPAFLEVTNLSPGSILNVPLVNASFDNNTGRIAYGAGTFSNFPTGTFTHLSITFRAKTSTGGTPISFITGGFPATDVTFEGSSVLGNTQAATVIISGNNPPPQPTSPPPQPTTPPGSTPPPQPTSPPPGSTPPPQPTDSGGTSENTGDMSSQNDFANIDRPCSQISAVTGGAVTASVPADITTREGNVLSVQCRVLTNPVAIGITDRPVQRAVDVYGLSPTDSGTRFNQNVQVCLRGSGSLLFRDANQAPRVTQPVAATSQNSYTCTNIANAGTLALVGNTMAETTGASASSPGSQESTYVVQRGDTLFRIALRYDVPLRTLTEANNLNDPADIYAGQTLIIPGQDTVSTGSVTSTNPSASSQITGNERTHTVQSGENLFRIAMRYDVPLATLAAVNGITNPQQIKAGQVLIIPD